MGLGMDVDRNGHNIVFTGGTGILVFLDLVARIVLQNCDAEVLNSQFRDLSNNECQSPTKQLTLEYYDSTNTMITSSTKTLQNSTSMQSMQSLQTIHRLELGDGRKFGPDFKLTLYFAAAKESEAIGLKLC